MLCNGQPNNSYRRQLSCCRQVEAVLRGGQSSREGELCVQALFTLLDMLRTWLAGQRGFAASSGAACLLLSLTKAHVCDHSVGCSGRQQCSASQLSGTLTASTLHAASTSTTSGTTGNGGAAGPAADPAIKHMADLLGSIPQELLACAAAHCGGA